MCRPGVTRCAVMMWDTRLWTTPAWRLEVQCSTCHRTAITSLEPHARMPFTPCRRIEDQVHDVGAARRDEYSAIRDIFAAAFPSQDEALLWDYLLEHDSTLSPSCVRVARENGTPVACTVVLLRTLQGTRGHVRGAIVTLVACDPDRQGRGYGSAAVQDAHAFMVESGCVLGILYGHPTFYPRFGYVPVFAGARTDLEIPPHALDSPPPLGSPRADDLPALLTLFDAQLMVYPGAVERSAAPWIWHPRMASIVSLPNNRGYAVLQADRAARTLIVREACTSRGNETELLRSLLEASRRENLSTLSLRTPPDLAVTRQARALGAETLVTPAGAGMAIVLDARALLPDGYRVDSTTVTYRDRPVLQAPRQVILQLLLGAADPGGPDITVAPEFREQVLRDFPERFPHWSLEPFWH